MPWKVLEREGQGWCVYTLDSDGNPTGDALGCHPTQAEARQQQSALYVNEASMKTVVKFADNSEIDIEGLLAPYGGPFNGRDVEGEYFSPKTEFALDWFEERPLLYHHGLEAKAGIAVVGRIKSLSKEEVGLWMKAQLDAASDYYDAIKELIRQGKLGLSSGSMRHLVEITKSGEIMRWPLVEGSLTPTPANPMAEVGFAAAKSHFKSIGAKFPASENALRAEWSARQVNDLPDSAFLYVEDGGEKDDDGNTVPRALRHFPVRGPDGELDEAHVRNALARIPQSTVSLDAKEQALAKARSYAEDLGIEVSEQKTGTGTLWSFTDSRGNTANITVSMTESKAVSEASMRKMIRNAAQMAGIEMDDAAVEKMMEELADVMDKDTEDIMKAIASYMNKKPTKMASWESVRNQVEEACRQHLMWANPFDPDIYCYVKETYSDHAIVCVAQKGEEKHFKVPFVLDEEGHVAEVGHPEEVEETYVPVKPMMGEMPMAMMAETTKTYIAELTERTKDLHERRTKEGRIISTANRKKLNDTLEAMAVASEVIKALLSDSEPPVKAEAVLARFKVLQLAASTMMD